MINHPNRSKITVVVGETYLTRDGGRIHIESETTNQGRTYVMQGVDEKGQVTWRSRKGRFSKAGPHPLDLVAIAPSKFPPLTSIKVKGWTGAEFTGQVGTPLDSDPPRPAGCVWVRWDAGVSASWVLESSIETA